MFKKLIRYEINKKFFFEEIEAKVSGENKKIRIRELLILAGESGENLIQKTTIDGSLSIEFNIGKEKYSFQARSYFDELFISIITCKIVNNSLPVYWYLIRKDLCLDFGDYLYNFFATSRDEYNILIESVLLTIPRNTNFKYELLEEVDSDDYYSFEKVIQSYKNFYSNTYYGNLISQKVLNRYSNDENDSLIDGVNEIVTMNLVKSYYGILKRIQFFIVVICILLIFIYIKI